MRDKLSPIAPYVASVGLVLIVGALVVQQLHLGPQQLPLALGIVGVVLLLILPLTRVDDMRSAFGSRQARFGGNAFLLAVSVIGILVVINVLGTLRFVRLDATKNQRFSISNQTKQILDDMREHNQQVKVTAVMASNDPRRSDLQQLMDRYAGYGNTVSFVALDPQLDQLKTVALVQSLGRDLTGNEVVVQSGTKTDVIYESDEKAITGSIIKVIRDKQKVIAFTTGHREYSTAGGDQRSFAALSQGLTQDGYKVVPVQVATSDTLKADVIIVAGAQEPFNPQELERLAKYQAAGGNILILSDPQDKADLTPLLEPYGLTLRNDLVIDTESPINPGVPVIRPEGVQYHEITRDLDTPSYLMTILPGARSIGVPTTPVSGTTTSVLFKTTDASWGETDLASLQEENAQPTKDETDASGPLDVAVAAEHTGTGAGPGRLVVFGSAGLVADSTLQQVRAPGNPVVTLNAINWLAQDSQLMGIQPTSQDDHPLKQPESKLLVFLATALFIPAAIAALGFYIWWQRR